MGSLKDEMRGLTEDHKLCEKADDGERPGSSDGSVEPGGPQINMSQKSSTQQSFQPELHTNTGYDEETHKSPGSKDEEDSGDRSDSADFIQTGTISVTQQPETTKDTQNSQIDGDGEDNTQEEEAGIENITIPVPPTPGPCEPCTPAPFGQHHMRTQVSLEVVQCQSIATSPMTPPEGGNSFFFPSSFVKSGGVGTDTKDAELQVGQQVEFCSVATSPMTPKTPFTTAFPELIGRETAKREERAKENQGQQVEKSLTESQKEAAETELGASNSDASPESSTCCPAVGSADSQTAGEGSKQQRMGSMDQDITILVTHHDNMEEEEEPESPVSPVEEEMIPECEEIKANNDVNKEEEKENIPTDAPEDAADDSKSPNKTEESSVSTCDEAKCENSGVKDVKVLCEDVNEVSAIKSPIPESPAPFGCHNIRTQVSLEVVQCQSAATSPMTPPEGDQAFCFPSSHMKCGSSSAETKDAELQVGQQVEYRSVATAPMTPRTPITTTFPEVKKETSLEEKIIEEEEEKKEETEEEEKKVKEEDTKEERNCKEKCEEPVQEVSWDEKGMTWEVYGAVVEVTVLGSAIQKHLEKQVKKQRRQPSMPPPPPLNPSAMPLNSGRPGKGKRGEQDGEAGRRRRNPFRQLMENMQQPHCCSRAHSAE
ncbi:G protein-regulated inducer of neurite outgrowth 1 [Cheilinus undulatus]|uniref:G protein-regulated inducer of neurite outgrowth 1 n=1 Tax=Cheilinus undulatus TaxID=241271 RepID=UPI001BD61A87|nr:G protein-regulated inducer of neurite outgrowth 1 [Cheilinus undulatus]